MQQNRPTKPDEPNELAAISGPQAADEDPQPPTPDPDEPRGPTDPPTPPAPGEPSGDPPPATRASTPSAPGAIGGDPSRPSKPPRPSEARHPGPLTPPAGLTKHPLDRRDHDPPPKRLSTEPELKPEYPDRPTAGFQRPINARGLTTDEIAQYVERQQAAERWDELPPGTLIPFDDAGLNTRVLLRAYELPYDADSPALQSALHVNQAVALANLIMQAQQLAAAQAPLSNPLDDDDPLGDILATARRRAMSHLDRLAQQHRHDHGPIAQPPSGYEPRLSVFPGAVCTHGHDEMGELVLASELATEGELERLLSAPCEDTDPHGPHDWQQGGYFYRCPGVAEPGQPTDEQGQFVRRGVEIMRGTTTSPGGGPRYRVDLEDHSAWRLVDGPFDTERASPSSIVLVQARGGRQREVPLSAWDAWPFEGDPFHPVDRETLAPQPELANNPTQISLRLRQGWRLAHDGFLYPPSDQYTMPEPVAKYLVKMPGKGSSFELWVCPTCLGAVTPEVWAGHAEWHRKLSMLPAVPMTAIGTPWQDGLEPLPPRTRRPVRDDPQA